MSPALQNDLLTRRLREREREKEALLKFPMEELVDIIMDVGFSCDLCARCCTRAFNGHVLLLDDEAAWIADWDPAALEPVPVFDFCDQEGTFYVSGYTIRTLQDRDGSCWFLDRERCRVYEFRPRVCRIYPYMLHREPDESGIVDWRQISGLNQHGQYHGEISRDNATLIARDVIAFEKAVLEHEIAFLEYTRSFFARKGLRHVRKMYDTQIRRLAQGISVPVRVYSHGTFDQWVTDGKVTRRMGVK
ncbi:MAG: YkgJ family cysteine cluster protein [Methanolinea sp.]|jgi:Fe-S-cluster containining protein|nr:YkgJ family cysteine cluster protein [Methanolinea sp.]